MSDSFLCRLDDIPDGAAAALVTEHEGQRIGLMGLRRGGKIYVYVNVCPHIGAPLDFPAGNFLNLEKTHIQCTNHGALFRIEDGYCVWGPCAGASLRSVAVAVRDGDVHVVE